MFRNNDIIANKKNISSVMLRFRTIALLIANYSLLITLLIVLLSCSELISEFNKPQYEDEHEQPFEQPPLEPPPAGKGYVYLNFELPQEQTAAANIKARTVMPTATVAKYTLTFTDVDGVNGTVTETLTQAQITGGTPVLLDAGEWNLIVTAKDSADNAIYEGGTASAFTISSSGVSSVTVSLSAIDNSGTGTFSWNITLSGITNLSTATMTVTPHPNGTAVTDFNNRSITSPGNTGSASLASGYYYIVIKLEKVSSEAKAPLYKQQILHIKNNMTSAYTDTFTNDHFANNAHTVTLNYNYTGATPASKTISRAHNQTLGAAETPTRTGYTFGGWYLDSACTDANSWGGATTAVTRTLTLYAKWTAITYTVTYEKNTTDTVNGLTTTSKTVTFDSNYDTLPTLTRTGYTFNGWYTLATGGTKVESTTTVTTASNHTIYAQWSIRTLIGDGTSSGPYEIWDVDDLVAVALLVESTPSYRSAFYIVKANINLTGVGWTPIGSETNKFNGNFNGNSKKISGLYIYNPTAHHQGLFAWVDTSGTVKNLELDNVNITGKSSVGGLAGMSYGTIEYVSVSGNITGDGNGDHPYQGVGGITGWNEGNLQNCFSTANVTGFNRVGGLAGVNVRNIQNCYSTGKILGNSASSAAIGGIAGFNTDNGKIQNCYSISNIESKNTSADGVGGIAGHSFYYSGSNIEITNCMALNPEIKTISNSQYVGRVGGGSGAGTFINNYARIDMVMLPGVTGDAGTSLTIAQIQTSTQWTSAANWSTTGGASAWDFTASTGIWIWNSASVLPTLRGVPGAQNPILPGTNSDNPIVFIPTSNTELDAAITAIKEGGDNKYYEIQVEGSLTMTPSADSNTYNFGTTKNITVTLTGGGEIKYTVSTAWGFEIGPTQHLILDEITLTGGSTTTRPYVCVRGGEVTMKAGATIQSNRIGTSYGGSAVYIVYGTFTMDGGLISNNWSGGTAANTGNVGAGVYLRAEGGDSIFIMNGGTIEGNRAAGAGGGVHVAGVDAAWGGVGIFTMNGGIITGNTSYNGAGGVHIARTVSGGGIFNGIIGNDETKWGDHIYGNTGTTANANVHKE